MQRCAWAADNDALMCDYHDKEWGVPVHDDSLLFEFLILETFQAGLSWKTILYKRDNFRKAFSGFDVEKVAAYSETEFNRLLSDAGIIRNRLKIQAAISNAQAFMKVQKEFESFNNYIWKFVNYNPLVNKRRSVKELPARTELSDTISNDLRKRGFKFVGSTVVYAHMQATDMVNDHLISCFRYKQISG